MQYIDDMSRIREIEKEYDLPELTGTYKQVAWARKIRANILFHLKYLVDNLNPDLLVHFNAIREQEEAKYWIDDRDSQWSYINSANACFFQQVFPEKFVYRPTHPVKEGMVDIIHMDGYVYYRYKSDADFRRIMGDLKYAGSGTRYGYPQWLEKRAKLLLLCGFTLNSDTELSVDQSIDIPEDLLDED